jgi:hypothetical protein
MEYFSARQVSRMKKSLYLLPHLQVLSDYSLTGNPCPRSSRELVYYPNPGNQNLMLDLREFESQTYTYQIYNEYGTMVLSGESSNELKSIDTSTLQEGHYYLHFYEDENSVPIIKHLYIQH